MKAVFLIILALLTLLAVSPGITKIMLMQQDVDFFGKVWEGQISALASTASAPS